jgi:hypothetical protein
VGLMGLGVVEGNADPRTNFACGKLVVSQHINTKPGMLLQYTAAQSARQRSQVLTVPGATVCCHPCCCRFLLSAAASMLHRTASAVSCCCCCKSTD